MIQHRVRSIYALGRLEPAEGIISVSAIPGERLLALDPDVAENKQVPNNGILGLLASYHVGNTQLSALINKKELASLTHLQQTEVARAQKKQAEAALTQAQAKRMELELQGGKLQTLEVAGQLAVEEYERLQSLRAQDPELVTEHQLRKRYNEMETALADFRISNESYASAKLAADSAVEAAEANIRVADRTLQQLKQNLEEKAVAQEIEVAKETLKRSILLSPHISPDDLDNVRDIELVADHEGKSAEGRGPLSVLKIFLRPGEFVSQTPIMQLGDLRQMVCIAEVYEADIKDLYIGQAAVIRSPAFSGKFADGTNRETGERTGGMAGTIERIGSVIGTPGLINRNPLAPADRSVVEVRVTIMDDEAIAEASRRVGLQVTVEFEKSGSESAETAQPQSKAQ